MIYIAQNAHILTGPTLSQHPTMTTMNKSFDQNYFQILEMESARKD